MNVLRGALAQQGTSIRVAALAVGMSKSSLGRWLLTEENLPLDLMGAIIQFIDDPSVAWKACPSWFGWPPYPEGADEHPAACALDAEQSVRDLLDELDGKSNPNNWSDEDWDAVEKAGNDAIRDIKRLLNSRKRKH